MAQLKPRMPTLRLKTSKSFREPVIERQERASRTAVADGTYVGTVGGPAIIRHPWVIPVVACDLAGGTAGGIQAGQFD